MTSTQGPVPISLATAHHRKPAWIVPLMLGGVAILLAALWSGLAHLGLGVAEGSQSLHEGHGPMMILGFLGTVIALERAVALGSTWAYIGPLAAAIGGLAVLFDAPQGIAAGFVTAGGAVLVGVFVVIDGIQRSAHNFVLGAGAICWVIAGALWLADWPIPRFLPWMAGFLILTITGERLELSRLTGASSRARAAFTAIASFFGIGLIISALDPSIGIRISGIGMLAVALWLMRYDIARRTIRTKGLTRYMAAALLTGYLWLATAGILWLVFGKLERTTQQPSAYDAMLHAVFLGFVISMIFAHAPIIIPSILGRQLPYHWVFYFPLVLLHASLLIRLIGGDVLSNLALWQWGGILNEIAFLLFMALALFNLFISPIRSLFTRAQRPAHRNLLHFGD